jgi:SAM-dependent methyltransferase
MNPTLLPRPSYPSELEAAWLGIACRVTRRKRWPDALRDLLPDVAALSDTLTTDREPGFGDYTNSKKALIAYGLFFFPQTYQRVAFTLHEWLVRHRPYEGGVRNLRVLDAGAGTGASSFAALDALAAHLPAEVRIELTAADQSEDSLKRLNELYRDLRPRWPNARLHTELVELPHLRRISRDPWDILLVSFALNELIEERGEDYLADWMDMALKCVQPGGALVLLEPATRPAALRLQHLRDRLAEQRDVTLLGPCLHHQPCPLLAQAPKVWCHEVKTWRAPESMRILNQTLRRDLAVVKWSHLVLQNQLPPASSEAPALMRLVSPLMLPKGKLAATGCGADGALHPHEMLTRNLTSTRIKQLKTIERGDLVTWPEGELLGDGVTRRAETPPDRCFGFE